MAPRRQQCSGTRWRARVSADDASREPGATWGERPTASSGSRAAPRPRGGVWSLAMSFQRLTTTALIEEGIEALACVILGTHERNDVRVVSKHRSLVSVVKERELAGKDSTSLVQDSLALLHFDFGSRQFGIQAREKIAGCLRLRLTPEQCHDQEHRPESRSRRRAPTERGQIGVCSRPLRQTPARQGTPRTTHAGQESSVSLRDRTKRVRGRRVCAASSRPAEWWAIRPGQPSCSGAERSLGTRRRDPD